MSEQQKGKCCKPIKYTDQLLSQLAQSLRAWVDDHAKRGEFALLGDWCFQVKFNHKYFKRYCEKHEEFNEAYQWAKFWQEHCIAKGALKKELDGKFSQFFLGCNHEWKVKEPIDEEDEKLRNDFAKFRAFMRSGATDKSLLDEDEIDD